MPTVTYPPIVQWAGTMREIAITKTLANISPPDGQPGSVLASPSRTSPNYYYHWVRDGARTMRALVYLYDSCSSAHKAQIAEILRDYVEFSKIQQVTPTVSNSLGEPKFYVTGEGYGGPWGRPQNDGPAQRALVLTRWALQLLKDGHSAFVHSVLYDGQEPSYSLIKADLDYVGHNWQAHCFDLWEEVDGTHFFTRMHQRAALREGAALATQLSDPGAANFFSQQAAAIESQMGSFWPNGARYLIETVNRTGGLNYKASNLDAAVILGSCETYYSHVPQYFSPSDEFVLATAYGLHTRFQALYPLNGTQKTPSGDPLFPAIGRYPEDQYTGGSGNEGNPWYLITLTMGALCYKASELIATAGSIAITGNNLAYLSLGLGLVSAPGTTISAGTTLTRGSAAFNAVTSGLIAMGDAYLRRVQTCTPSDGSLSEQFDRIMGAPTSAYDLTWSYVAMVLAAQWRKESVAALTHATISLTG
jgi:glucoamylase